MKPLLLFSFFTLAYQLSIAQCTAPANNFGNNTTPGYDITGDVSVVLNTDNTVTLNLGSNFSTANGPDVRAYLVNSNGMSDTQLGQAKIADLTNIEFGLVGCTGCVPTIPSSGSKSFTVAIPSGQDIRGYDKVLFYCLQFNAFWDVGSFTSFSNANCNVLSVNEAFKATDFKIYPNPSVNDVLNIENNKQLPLTASLYDTIGKEVLKIKETNRSEIKINLSTLETGVYLLQTTHKDATITKRIIKH